MTNLWLIAHKVRGEPAFDIATQMVCPICNGFSHYSSDPSPDCKECDGLGFWWIIPTSGHRAYPYATQQIGDGFHDLNISCEFDQPIPEGLPDHYKPRAEPSRLEQLKALLPPAKPIRRRF